MKAFNVWTLVFIAPVFSAPSISDGAKVQDLADLPYEIQERVLKGIPIESLYAGATANSKWRDMIRRYRHTVVDSALKALQHFPDTDQVSEDAGPSTVLQDQAALVPLFDGFIISTVIQKLIRPFLKTLNLAHLDQPRPADTPEPHQSFGSLFRPRSSFLQPRPERSVGGTSTTPTSTSYDSTLANAAATANLDEAGVASILATYNNRASETKLSEFKSSPLEGTFYPALQLVMDGKVAELVQLTGWAHSPTFAAWVAKHIAPLIPGDLAQVADYLADREVARYGQLFWYFAGYGDNHTRGELPELNQPEEEGLVEDEPRDTTTTNPAAAASNSTTDSMVSANDNWRLTLLPSRLAENLLHSIILTLVQRGNLADLADYLNQIRMNHPPVDPFVPLVLIMAASVEIPNRRAIFKYFKPELKAWNIHRSLYKCAPKHGWLKVRWQFFRIEYAFENEYSFSNLMVRCHLAVPNNAVAHLTSRGHVSLRFYHNE
ncbi:hypothetical protein BJ085DRAFT_32564 [Dimargaris cristalligena]|uniref:F-box domain-containing protein n=1 Tax=Dimargaris cristalligena TaxID=215637 RepID=A0A4Q0A074_9FUNG|nr:hypothetical protein BJ085DRAFT_32564 [Dimargaris cristalligena]|eukprot:RKP38652.1 hypothetical protein BJ085DRAFT_32564 [Dimargaris cristalligena]